MKTLLLAFAALALPACAGSKPALASRVPAATAGTAGTANTSAGEKELDLSASAGDQRFLNEQARAAFAQVEKLWRAYQSNVAADARARHVGGGDTTLWLDQYRRNFDELAAQTKALRGRGFLPLEKPLVGEGFLPAQKFRLRRGETRTLKIEGRPTEETVSFTFFYTQYFAPAKGGITMFQALPSVTLKGTILQVCTLEEPRACEPKVLRPLEVIVEWAPAQFGRGANSSAGGAGNDD